MGSSAAYSTCVASSLLLAHQHIALPSGPHPLGSHAPLPTSPPEESEPRLAASDTDLVDGWAFLAEKVLHGNPSGIDNAVSVRGGAVAFTRSVGGKKGGLQGLHG